MTFLKLTRKSTLKSDWSEDVDGTLKIYMNVLVLIRYCFYSKGLLIVKQIKKCIIDDKVFLLGDASVTFQ